ncbi:hypothetical protein D3C75_1002630 [compost metagenome]
MAVGNRIKRRGAVQLTDPVICRCGCAQIGGDGKMKDALFMAQPDNMIGGDSVPRHRRPRQQHFIERPRETGQLGLYTAAGHITLLHQMLHVPHIFAGGIVPQSVQHQHDKLIRSIRHL